MEKPLFQNSLYEFVLLKEPNALVFNWKDETRSMTYDDFQEACGNYAGFVIEYHTANLIVNSKEFHFELPEKYRAWKNENLNPRYAKAGVSKQAFVMRTKDYELFKQEEVQDEGYVNRYFDTQEQAVTWLNADLWRIIKTTYYERHLKETLTLSKSSFPNFKIN